MAVSSLGDAFSIVMERCRWTGAHLARQVGASQPWVSMVLAGHRDPGMRRSAELLRRVGWELILVPAGETGEDDPVERREFLTAASVMLLVPPSPAGAAPYSSPGYVSALTARLAASEAQMGGAPLAGQARRHARRAIAAAAGSRSAELQSAASRLCRQAALILHDVRQLAEAEKTAQAAMALAGRAGDLLAQARACDTLSMITAHQPDGRGAAYARRGLAVPDLTGDDRAILSARLGRALALAPGHRSEARRSLEQALESSGGNGASAVEVFGNTGIGFADLHIPARADELLTAAAGLAAPRSPFEQSLYLSRRTKAAITGRDPEAAAGVMHQLAGVAPLVDSPRLSIHVRHILDGTRTWAAIPGVRTAREQLTEVTS